MKCLGIDIGGSAVKGAPVDTRTGKLLAERCRIATLEPLKPADMARTVGEIARHFRWRGRIGIGFPGVVQGSRILTAANLHPRFVGADADRLFARATGCAVALINDADAAGLAEMRFGAGREIAGTVLLVTIGTGIGTAVFSGGALLPNTEFGHLPLRGRSAERFVSSAARKRRGLSWPEWGRELGAYLRILEMLLWPEVIVIGGGAASKSSKFLRHLRCRTRITIAASGNEAGIVGAALHAAAGVAERSPQHRKGGGPKPRR